MFKERINIILMLLIILTITISPVYADDSNVGESGTFGTIGGIIEGGVVSIEDDKELEIEQEKTIRLIKKHEVLNAPSEAEAIPTTQKITVDGEEVNFRAYNIKGHNYFMLRDVAHIFKGTAAEFEVGWDGEKFAISLETGKPYTGEGVGFNMTKPHIKETGLKSKATIYKDGEEIKLLGYTIYGNTYFKLRDLGYEFDIGVSWDSVNKTVVLKSDGTLIEEELELAKEEEEEVVEEVEEVEEDEVVKEDEKLTEPEEWDPFNTADLAIDWDNVKPTTEKEKQEMREYMLKLINEKREERGIVKLKLDDKLIEISEFKSADMKEYGYGHNGSYGTFRDLMVMNGINVSAGENVAMGQISAEMFFNAWWTSKGHRENMMRPEFRKIGIGFADKEYQVLGLHKVPSDIEDEVVYKELVDTYYYEGWSFYGTQHFTE